MMKCAGMLLVFQMIKSEMEHSATDFSKKLLFLFIAIVQSVFKTDASLHLLPAGVCIKLFNKKMSFGISDFMKRT